MRDIFSVTDERLREFLLIAWHTAQMLKRAPKREKEIQICSIAEDVDPIILWFLRLTFGRLGYFKTENFGHGLPFGILVFVRNRA